ncbi:MAG: hypothetical protein Q9226_007889 [Calogaya cf. arnoldii]
MRTARYIALAVTSFSPQDPFLIEDPTDLFWFRREVVPERVPATFISRIPLSLMQLIWPGQHLLAAEQLKLPRFDFADYPVEYHKNLGSGGEGVVLLATIAGKQYAMKMFFRDKWRVPWDIEDMDWYLEDLPFAKECRAYTRIHQYNLDGVYTPKCYGWMKVDRDALVDALNLISLSTIGAGYAIEFEDCTASALLSTTAARATIGGQSLWTWAM